MADVTPAFLAQVRKLIANMEFLCERKNNGCALKLISSPYCAGSTVCFGFCFEKLLTSCRTL